MSDAFQPILRYGSPCSYPGVPLATMMFEISLGWVGSLPFSPVTAVMETSPDISVPALVMNCLAPLIVQPSPESAARVWTLPASEPASGSVSPKEARRSPVQSCGSHSSFCASVPQR